MTGLYVRDVRQVDAALEALLRRREEQGLDRLDEVWEGILHMSPPPHGDHQELVGWLAEVFRTQARRHGLGKVYVQPGVREPGSGASNFRVPDLAILTPDLPPLVEGWIEQGPALAVEVRSPREEAMEKRAFYAARSVAEILYIDYRTFALELLRLAGKDYVAVSADREGFCEVRSLALRVRRVEREGDALLEFEDARGGGPLPPL